MPMMTKEHLIMMRVLNAVVIAGITFLSSLSVAYPPTVNNIYAAFIAFSLTFLVQIKGIIDDLCGGQKKGGKSLWLMLI